MNISFTAEKKNEKNQKKIQTQHKHYIGQIYTTNFIKNSTERIKLMYHQYFMFVHTYKKAVNVLLLRYVQDEKEVASMLYVILF